MPKYRTVTELTELNIALNKNAEDFVALTDRAKADMRNVRGEIKSKYSSNEFADLPKSNRQQMITYESRKAVAQIQKVYQGESKGQIREISKLSGEINEAADAYNPIKRLNIETSRDKDQSERRARYQQLMQSSSVHDLMTMMDVFESTNDRSGLAAISSVVSATKDKNFRKALPNARIVKNIQWPDQDQLDAIFHAGKHMTSIALEHNRSVTAAANGKVAFNGVDRVRQGLRDSEQDNE